MRRKLLTWVGLSLSFLVHRPCVGQLIQVGPGFVKAPFVRVEWDGYGGSHVRAPFVNVVSPSYAPMYRSASYAPSATTRDAEPDYTEMDYASLRRAIRTELAGLELDVGRDPALREWQSQLDLDSIRDWVRLDQSGPPTDEQRGALTAFLQRLGEAQRFSQNNSIMQLASYRRTRAVIAEFLLPPDQRLLNQIGRSAKQLYQSLDRVQNGSGWQTYLSLNSLIDGSSNKSLLTQGDRSALLAIAERFDEVEQSETYRPIAELPGFRAVRQRLSALVDLIKSIPPIDSPVMEELPRPAPESSRG